VTLDPTDRVQTILTPDFLRYNEIVPGDWRLEKPVFVSPAFTHMLFDSGFTVQAEEVGVEFSVPVDDSPGPDAGICNDVVRRFLGVLLGLDLARFSIGIDGYALMPDGCTGIVNIGTPLDGQIPVVSHRSRFYLPDREVTFRVREVGRGDCGGFINSLDFRLLTTYSADAFPEDSLLSILEKTLEEWEKLLTDFVELATGFYSRHIEAG
jgi:hypothetical protein